MKCVQPLSISFCLFNTCHFSIFSSFEEKRNFFKISITGMWKIFLTYAFSTTLVLWIRKIRKNVLEERKEKKKHGIKIREAEERDRSSIVDVR